MLFLQQECIAGTVLSARDAAATKIDKSLCLPGADITPVKPITSQALAQPRALANAVSSSIFQ